MGSYFVSMCIIINNQGIVCHLTTKAITRLLIAKRKQCDIQTDDKKNMHESNAKQQTKRRKRLAMNNGCCLNRDGALD